MDLLYVSEIAFRDKFGYLVENKHPKYKRDAKACEQLNDVLSHCMITGTTNKYIELMLQDYIDYFEINKTSFNFLSFEQFCIILGLSFKENKDLISVLLSEETCRLKIGKDSEGKLCIIYQV